MAVWHNSSVCGQATRSTARIEEKLSRRAKKESRGTLWKRHPGRGTVIRDRVDDRESNSLIPNMQRVQEQGMSCRR